jgi:hypothetical protein
MNENIRSAGWTVGKFLKNTNLLDRFSPDNYLHAKAYISCECPTCQCPARSACRYSFVYIDEGKRLMYFDVPKSASTTIRKAFFDNKLSASMTNPQTKRGDYFKFAFVRNPWDRMVSNWKMFTTQPPRIDQLKSMTDADLSNFGDFVDFAIRKSNHHWQPQALYVPEDIDFLGKIETFGEDMGKLLELTHQPPLELGRHNSTERKKYQDYYTPELVDVVGAFYQDDIKRFDYQF